MTIKHTSHGDLRLRDDKNTGFNIDFHVGVDAEEILMNFIGVVEGRRIVTTIHKIPLNEAYELAAALFDGIRDLEEEMELSPRDFTNALNFNTHNTSED